MTISPGLRKLLSKLSEYDIDLSFLDDLLDSYLEQMFDLDLRSSI